MIEYNEEEINKITDLLGSIKEEENDQISLTEYMFSDKIKQPQYNYCEGGVCKLIFPSEIIISKPQKKEPTPKEKIINDDTLREVISDIMDLILKYKENINHDYEGEKELISLIRKYLSIKERYEIALEQGENEPNLSNVKILERTLYWALAAVEIKSNELLMAYQKDVAHYYNANSSYQRSR